MNQDGSDKGQEPDGEVNEEVAERDDLQSPIVHEGASSEHHDGNEEADDLVEVVEPDGEKTPRVANKGGRSAHSDEAPPDGSPRDANSR